MANQHIFVHGLGQSAKSWDKVILKLDDNQNIYVPNLFTDFKTDIKSYNDLYNIFSKYCNDKDGKVNLCGLS